MLSIYITPFFQYSILIGRFIVTTFIIWNTNTLHNNRIILKRLFLSFHFMIFILSRNIVCHTLVTGVEIKKRRSTSVGIGDLTITSTYHMDIQFRWYVIINVFCLICFDEEGARVCSSTNEFHWLHSGHLPTQRGDS